MRATVNICIFSTHIKTNTFSLIYFCCLALVISVTNFFEFRSTQQQDTTSAKVWRQRAYEATKRAEFAAKEALQQKAIAEKMATEISDLKKMLAECEGRKK